MVGNVRDHAPANQLTFHSRKYVPDLRLNLIAESCTLPEPQLGLEGYVIVVVFDSILPVLQNTRFANSVCDTPRSDGVEVPECPP